MDNIISRALGAAVFAGTAALMAAGPAVADAAPSEVALNTGKSALQSLTDAKPIEMIKNAKVMEDSLKLH
ncbi:hypothetical protein [Streptomyces sp. NPDC016845]|uniref:hypothetical protein n=1 Tax=Streptomyces sp. NPDC016845 TaxID=3364972 RepID=UPI0037AF6C89